MKKSQIITLLFILATIILIIYIIQRNSHHTEADLIACINSKATLYVSTGCSACKYQEKLFGENFDYLETIDCALTPEKCTDIQAVPTWIINQKKYVGVQSIEKLKELTGCEE